MQYMEATHTDGPFEIQLVMCTIMMTEIQTTDWGQKDVSSLGGTTFKLEIDWQKISHCKFLNKKLFWWEVEGEVGLNGIKCSAANKTDLVPKNL